jgi:nucleotide-binding universal stress UspA family protein
MTTDTGRATHPTTPQQDAERRTVSDAEHVTLVVGHDGHPASTAALSTAIDLAQRLGAHLHVIHSVTIEDYGIDPDSEAFELERDRNLARERERIAGTLAGTSAPWTYHEQHGDPADQLAALANEVNAALIIVGATRHGVVHHLLGSDSVPKRLLHVQSRPVVVVPPAPAPH